LSYLPDFGSTDFVGILLGEHCDQTQLQVTFKGTGLLIQFVLGSIDIAHLMQIDESRRTCGSSHTHN
jgi:hypothetical protein